MRDVICVSTTRMRRCERERGGWCAGQDDRIRRERMAAENSHRSLDNTRETAPNAAHAILPQTVTV